MNFICIIYALPPNISRWKIGLNFRLNFAKIYYEKFARGQVGIRGRITQAIKSLLFFSCISEETRFLLFIRKKDHLTYICGPNQTFFNSLLTQSTIHHPVPDFSKIRMMINPITINGMTRLMTRPR